MLPKCYPEIEKEKEKDIYIASKEKELFDYWNSLEIIKHKQLTEPIRKAIKKAIDTYKDIEVINALIIPLVNQNLLQRLLQAQKTILLASMIYQ